MRITAVLAACALLLFVSGARRPPKRAAAPKVATALVPAAPTGGYMIAPFPVPGDTSRASAERLKTMNVPRQGVTTIAPLPPPVGLPMPGMTIPAAPLQIDGFPEVLLRVPPHYPDAARDAGIQGTVSVGAHVREDGTVDTVVVIRSVAGLDSVAMECVKQWRFRPASMLGRPVPAWVGIPVRFTLH